RQGFRHDNTPFRSGSALGWSDIAAGAQTERRGGAGPAGACLAVRTPPATFLITRSVVVQDRAEAAVLCGQRLAAQVEQVQIERLVGLTLVVALVNPSRRQTRKARLPELLPANAEDEGCLAKEQDGTEKVFELAADIMDEVFECFADQTEGRADR